MTRDGRDHRFSHAGHAVLAGTHDESAVPVAQRDDEGAFVVVGGLTLELVDDLKPLTATDLHHIDRHDPAISLSGVSSAPFAKRRQIRRGRQVRCRVRFDLQAQHIAERVGPFPRASCTAVWRPSAGVESNGPVRIDVAGVLAEQSTPPGHGSMRDHSQGKRDWSVRRTSPRTDRRVRDHGCVAGENTHRRPAARLHAPSRCRCCL